MSQPVKLAVVTGTRAEYGLLRPVIQNLMACPEAELSVLVTGAHLAPEYGNTVAEIEADGVPVAARIPILAPGESGPLATAGAVERTIHGFVRWFAENRPACVLVLGDRYEIFAVAQAAAFAGVPVAHISGGDVTLGARRIRPAGDPDGGAARRRVQCGGAGGREHPHHDPAGAGRTEPEHRL